MENICQFIESLGGLHDAKTLSLQWLPTASRFELVIKDLYANFDGLPEYEGPREAKFVFSDVSDLTLSVNLSERGLLLDEWIIQKVGQDDYCSELRFSPSGVISVKSGGIECVESS